MWVSRNAALFRRNINLRINVVYIVWLLNDQFMRGMGKWYKKKHYLNNPQVFEFISTIISSFLFSIFRLIKLKTIAPCIIVFTLLVIEKIKKKKTKRRSSLYELCLSFFYNFGKRTDPTVLIKLSCQTYTKINFN